MMKQTKVETRLLGATVTPVFRQTDFKDRPEFFGWPLTLFIGYDPAGDAGPPTFTIVLCAMTASFT